MLSAGGGAGAGVGRDETGAMEAVAALWRSALRRQWRGWLVLILLLAIGAGSGHGVPGGGSTHGLGVRPLRREAGGIPDVNTGHGLPPEEAEATIEGFDGRGQPRHRRRLRRLRRGARPDAAQVLHRLVGQALVPWVGADARDGPATPTPIGPTRCWWSARAWRPPASSPATRSRSRCSRTDFSETVPKTGRGRRHGDDPWRRSPTPPTTAAPSTSPPPSRRPTRPSSRCGRPASSSRAPDPDAEGPPDRQLNDIGWSIDETRPVSQARVQDAIRPLVTVLALLGGLVLATTLLVVGQALARQIRRPRRRSATPPGRWGSRAASCASRRARRARGRRSRAPSWPCALAVAASSALPDRSRPSPRPRRRGHRRPHRARRRARRACSSSSCCSAASATRDASEATDRSRWLGRSSPACGASARRSPRACAWRSVARPASGASSGRRWRVSAAGLSLLVGGLAFVAALDRLTEDPVRYGASWDLTTRNAFGDVPPDDVRALTADDPDIVGLTGGSLNSVLVDDGLNVPMMAFLPITADLWPTRDRRHRPAERRRGARRGRRARRARRRHRRRHPARVPVRADGRAHRRHDRGHGGVPVHRAGRRRPGPPRPGGRDDLGRLPGDHGRRTTASRTRSPTWSSSTWPTASTRRPSSTGTPRGCPSVTGSRRRSG